MNNHEEKTIMATMMIIIAFVSSFFFRPAAIIVGGILLSIGVVYSTCFILYKTQPKIWDEVHKAKEEKNNNMSGVMFSMMPDIKVIVGKAEKANLIIALIFAVGGIVFVLNLHTLILR